VKRAALILAWWVAAFGVWPLADPGHDGTAPLVVLDIALHFAAGYYLLSRFWRSLGIVRIIVIRDATVDTYPQRGSIDGSD
jgi:hypothetical protein